MSFEVIMRRAIPYVALLAFATLNLAIVTRSPARAIPECPTITIDCYRSLQCEAEPYTFSAAINGGDTSLQPTFKWTISEGTITGGQGTPTIAVDVHGLGGRSVTATVEISGLTALAANCIKTASCTRQVSFCEYARIYDRYGKIPFKKEKERLDNLAIQLKAEPGSQATIIVYGAPRALEGDAEAHGNRIKDYLVNKHGIQAERIVIVTGGNVPDDNVELWLNVPGKNPRVMRIDAVKPRSRRRH